MSWNKLDRIEGIAIDDANTMAHHQLLSVDQQRKVINCTMFYAPLKGYTPREVPRDFVKTMKKDITEDQREIDGIRACYGKFIEAIRPHGASYAFQEDRFSKALNFELPYNENNQVIGMEYAPVIARMDQKITYSDAKECMPDHPELKILHDVAAKLKGGSGRGKLSFEEVMTRFICYISRKKMEYDFFDSLDCIIRNDQIYREPQNPHKNKKKRPAELPIDVWAACNNRYKTVLQYEAEGYDDMPKYGQTETSASRVDTGHINIMMTCEKAMTGHNPFPEEVTAAVVQFKKHAVAWKRMGRWFDIS